MAELLAKMNRIRYLACLIIVNYVEQTYANVNVGRSAFGGMSQIDRGDRFKDD